MKIKPVDMAEQLRMIRGVDGIYPKPQEMDATPGGQKTSFIDFLSKQLSEANSLGLEAEAAIKRSLEGKELNPHATMIAVQKAGISLTLLMSVKQKLETVYQELIRTPI